MTKEVEAALQELIRSPHFDAALVVAGEMARLMKANEMLVARCQILSLKADPPTPVRPPPKRGQSRPEQYADSPPVPQVNPELRSQLSDDPDKLIKRTVAAVKYLGVANSSTLDRREASDPFWPEPVKLSPKRVMYRERDVKAYLARLAAEPVGPETSGGEPVMRAIYS
jgi:predicted DNA-binding transcriptional regulator AlpA